MSDMKRKTGKSSVDGTVLYKVPAGKKATLTGMLVSNAGEGIPHAITVYLNDILITGRNAKLKPGASIEFIIKSHNLMEGDTITAFSDEDDVAHILLSYLET